MQCPLFAHSGRWPDVSPLCARSGRCYKWQGFKRQNVYFILQHLNYLEFFCDQLHIVRKMSRAGEKPLMLFLPVFKA